MIGFWNRSNIKYTLIRTLVCRKVEERREGEGVWAKKRIVKTNVKNIHHDQLRFVPMYIVPKDCPAQCYTHA